MLSEGVLYNPDERAKMVHHKHVKGRNKLQVN
jgi:hypothetical protein